MSFLKWAAGLFVVAACVAVAIHVGHQHTPGVCKFPAILQQTKDMGPYGCLDFWLNRYQTLIGGGLTIVAAVIAYYAVRWQVGREEHREAVAARAILPLALSSIVSYLEQTLKEIERYHIEKIGYDAGTGEPNAKQPILKFPTWPVGAVESIQEALRWAESEAVKPLAILLNKIQVYRARFDRSQGSTVDLAQHVEDALDLFIRAEDLFDYARSEGGPPPVREPDPDRMRGKLPFVFRSPIEIPGLEEKIHERGIQQGKLRHLFKEASRRSWGRRA